MSIQRLIVNSSSLTVADFNSICDLAPGGNTAGITLANFFSSLPAHVTPSLVSINVGAVQASGTITQTSTGAANGETLTVAGVTFTARTSGATGNEWNRSNTVATSATNLAAAINASTDVNIYVSASALLGVVTITALVPGVLGNLIALTESCANTSVSGAALASGSEGTAHSLDFR